MARQRLKIGKGKAPRVVPFTAEEETARDAEEAQAAIDKASDDARNTRVGNIRSQMLTMLSELETAHPTIDAMDAANVRAHMKKLNRTTTKMLRNILSRFESEGI